LFFVLVSLAAAQPLVPVPITTNVTVRVMAANLNDNSQTYQPFALRIFQGLKPDVVAIQEFNYLGNTPGEFRAMIDSAFGTNFVFFRETGAGYSIPNGVISRWPILEAGSWEDIDTGVNNRGFAWAKLDLPGTNDLYVVSVHLKADSSSASRRAAEAAQLKGLIQSNFPANAWMVLAGDCNIHSPAETALATLKSFLSDDPIPTDAASGGDPDTNNSRAARYDYVLPSPTLNTNRVATVLGSRTFPNGLVFDSRIYSPLSEVAPVVAADSGMAQHMAVVKDFRISYTVTNRVPLPAPVLALVSTNVVHWTGPSGLAYTVQRSDSLTNWSRAGTARSATTNYWFTNTPPASDWLFWRVAYP
jgi:endonuclease/exonuclease/phosphatase family metal-dependent hydrolase